MSNVKLILVFLCFALLQGFNSQAQSKGFLGHKVKVDFSFKPTHSSGLIFNAIDEERFIPYSSSEIVEVRNETSLKDREGVLRGSEKGLDGNNIYSAFELSIGFQMNRTEVLGFSVSQGRMYSKAFIFFENGFAGGVATWDYVVPNRLTSYQINYEFYDGIAPLKRYFKLGIGLDVVTPIINEIESGAAPGFGWNLQNSQRTEFWSTEKFQELYEDYELKIPYFTLGIGTNNFIIRNIYYKLAVDLNLSAGILKEEQNAFKFEDTFLQSYPYRTHFASRLISFNFGVGVNF